MRSERTSRVRCFAPIADEGATRLILGSMPGVASLRAGQYYAHPRNSFWRILGEFLGVDHRLPYARRRDALADAGIALWDVLRSCARIGSLDAAIEPDSIVANDFGRFFADHPRVRRVYFNGLAAEQYYRRLVLPRLPAAADLTYARLPSTSPAHAGKSFEDKLAAWRAVIDGAAAGGRSASRARRS